MGRYPMLLVAVAALVVGGCYESRTPTRYEPGVYKGETDPLLEKLESEELQAGLEERFERAAADR